jgi:uncharacterized protein with ATP-grasp and redox domains
MKTYLDCIPCFMRQALDAARLATDDEKMQELVVRKVAVLANELDMNQSPPAMGQKIHRFIRELVGVDDPYRSIKVKFNDIALQLYPQMRQKIISSNQPLVTAVRLAIAGNIIDFGVKGSLQESDLAKTINECLTADFVYIQLKLFQQAITDAGEILYIADNAGEILFDRLLIEQLPIEKVTIAVKGSPVINDATMKDALIAGLPRIVDVIDNGSDVPGTILESCSQSFRDRFNKADLVIAKGQGNYETLSDIDKNIFFILQAKCPVIARDLDCKVGGMILQRTKSFKGEKKNSEAWSEKAEISRGSVS